MAKSNPLISVIMPAYNVEQYILNSIRSVQAQTYTNWELIIVDDCSTDGTWGIIQYEAAHDARIRLFRMSANHHAGPCRNKAMQEAKGWFYAFLDSDDIWEPTKLERQLDFMLTNGYAFTFTAYDVIDVKGISRNLTIHVPSSIDYAGYLHNTIIGCLTVMVDVSQTGPFVQQDLKSAEEMTGWLQILKSGINAYGLDEVLSHYRERSDSLTHNKLQAAFRLFKVYRLEGLSWSQTLGCWLSYAYNAIRKRIK